MNPVLGRKKAAKTFWGQMGKSEYGLDVKLGKYYFKWDNGIKVT